ncbi:MAG: methylenetetrahydrofolate reductase [NAD(P)H] [Crocinitomicaceae bacterium]|nr:methylenetetrahydrofolate reductase [NAD(P)H] [Crocinitomicaceae bacterium]|tara:strand:+ start:5344 stop:6300 length:957 start_codon:yes stop_codon:yes gene_type:complete
MNVIESIEKSKGETLFSFEILPPLKGSHIDELFGRIDPLMEFNPSFVNVTYHREEYIYKKRPNGLLEKQATRKRPGTVGICAAIKNKYHVETVPHLTCGGFTREETEDALIDLNFLGIHNVLALRGDALKSDNRFIPDEGGHEYAVDLVKQIVNMNQSKYLSDELINPSPTEFCIGVAGYPEKHFESMNLKTDLRHLKEKIDAGAEYIVTQMFFDNEKFFAFVEKCREMGITVPIIPGLKPITVKNHISFLPKTFSIDFPDTLADELEKCSDNKEINEVGIEWCIEQSKELKKAGVPSLHYYTMGKSETVRRIASAVY